MTDKDADKPQLDKFKELAKELGCDEDEAAFAAVITSRHQTWVVNSPRRTNLLPVSCRLRCWG